MQDPRPILTLGHSPDPDDAFMWWPITGMVEPRERDGRGVARAVSGPAIDTGRFRFVAVPDDIERLNRRAEDVGDLEVTALSMHAYAHVKDRYVLTSCGSSMGDGYGPKLVAREDRGDVTIEAARAKGSGLRIAVPGTRTTAFLVLSLMLGKGGVCVWGGAGGFEYFEMSFDRIVDAVATGQADAGLVIHDAQLTFAQAGLRLVVDLGAWWKGRTGLPLPLGGNALRRDMETRFGEGTLAQVAGILARSIRYALDHRDESMRYAAGFAPGISARHLERFVDMYVNELTLDAGERGAAAIQRMLDEGHERGLCPSPGRVQMVRPR